MEGGELASVIEFPLPNFWKLVKQQRDIESPLIGYSQGFYFRILVHPRGTEQESSHLSVFLEALKQPWFPDDWIFPNVRFDLTVVNWRDPKDNVNSWAHWTFCDDTTSRGWQRMLPQSKISRARGFLNDEDTLLVRGKAEPVFWGPWSRRTLTFLPRNLWDVLPSPSTLDESYSRPPSPPTQAPSESTKRLHRRITNAPSAPGVTTSTPMRSTAAVEAWECMVPTLSPSLQSDYLSCMIHVLFHLKPLRRRVCSWQPRGSSAPVIQALQQTFAQMQLWPLVMCMASENGRIGRPVRDLLNMHNAAVTVPHDPLVASVLDKQPSNKLVMKSLDLNCVQRMTFNDPFVELHQLLFKAIHEECKVDYITELFGCSGSAPRGVSRLQSLQLDSFLDSAMSTSQRRDSVPHPQHPYQRLSDGAYSQAFIKIRHVQSVQKALEASGRLFENHPHLLFVYVTPQRATRKGELFDVPLRLDASFMASGSRAQTRDHWYSLYALIVRDTEGGGGASLTSSNGYYLIIRPDEEGPWFRICDGRAEKLVPRMPFAEWKCHRDFLCASAVYLAEDYIDSQTPIRVTDLRHVNPPLYKDTLAGLGVPDNFLDSLWQPWKNDPAPSPLKTALATPFAPFARLFVPSEARRSLDSVSNPNFFDRCRVLLTDAISRKDADDLHTILVEVFGVAAASDYNWTLAEAARRAIRVASAVDGYLRAEPEGEAAIELDTPGALEAWVTRQVSVVWDLLAGVDGLRPALSGGFGPGKTPFADVFCLAILEAVEFRVLRTALVPSLERRGLWGEERSGTAKRFAARLDTESVNGEVSQAKKRSRAGDAAPIEVAAPPDQQAFRRLLKCIRPSGSRVLSICYGSVVASRRVQQATRRDLLRMKRRIGLRNAPMTTQPVKRRRSEPETDTSFIQSPPRDLLDQQSLFSQETAASFDPAFPSPAAVGLGKRARLDLVMEHMLGTETEGPGVTRLAGRRPAESSEATVYIDREASFETIYRYVRFSVKKRLRAWAQSPKDYDPRALLPVSALGSNPMLEGSDFTPEGVEGSITVHLYALTSSDSGPTSSAPEAPRKRRGRWMFLNPQSKVSELIGGPLTSEGRVSVSDSVSEIQLLVVLAPIVKAPAVSPTSAKPPSRAKKVSRKRPEKDKSKSKAVPSAPPLPPMSPLPSPAEDVTRPLLLFKWFDRENVELVSLGAALCEARSGLQTVIGSWVLLRALTRAPQLLRPLWHYLDPADPLSCEKKFIPVPQDAAEWASYYRRFCQMVTKQVDLTLLCVVAEELYAPHREFQNIRRFNASVRKLNKRTSEIIVLQWSSILLAPQPLRPPSLLRLLRKCGSDRVAEIVAAGGSMQAQANRLAALRAELAHQALCASRLADGLPPIEDANMSEALAVTPAGSTLLAIPSGSSSEADNEPVTGITDASADARRELGELIRNVFAVAAEIRRAPLCEEVEDVSAGEDIEAVPAPSHSPDAGRKRKKRTPKTLRSRRKMTGPRRLVNDSDSQGCLLLEDVEGSLAGESPSSLGASLELAEPLRLLRAIVAPPANRSRPLGLLGDPLALGLLDPAFREALGPAVCESLSGSELEQKVLRAVETVMDPLTPPQGSKTLTEWPSKEWARQLGLMIDGLPEASRQAFARCSMWEIRERLCEAALETAVNTPVVEECSRSRRLTSEETFPLGTAKAVDCEIDGRRRYSAPTEELIRGEGFENGICFFQWAMKENRSLLVITEFLAGLCATNARLGFGRALHSLTLEALVCFQVDPDGASAAAALAALECGFESQRPQVRRRYLLAISICYALFLSLPLLPDIFSTGRIGSNFYRILTRRLERSATFALAVLTGGPAANTYFRRLNQLLLQSVVLVSQVVVNADGRGLQWPEVRFLLPKATPHLYSISHTPKIAPWPTDPQSETQSEEGWPPLLQSIENGAESDKSSVHEESVDEIDDDFSVEDEGGDEEGEDAVPTRQSPVLTVGAYKRSNTGRRGADPSDALRRRAGRSLVHKDEPRVVRESKTWFVVSKPAFWHCSGPGQSTEHPVDLGLLESGAIEEATAGISLPKLQRSGKMESFHLWMMKKFPELETVKKWRELECGLCHRIDLETSGALLIAKTHRSRDLIWEQFRRRYVHKEYLLLCHGRITELQGAVKTRLLTKDYGTNKSRRIKSHFTTVVAEGGEVALTEYHVCKVFRRKGWTEIHEALRDRPQRVGENVMGEPKASGSAQTSTTRRSAAKDDSGTFIDGGLTGSKTSTEEFSLCKCRIITGRTHQIRVHMRHIGHPLVSDTKYLDQDRCQEDRQWCPRMFLHAAALEFADPDAQPGTFTEAICPLAHELLQAIEAALACTDDYVNLDSYGVTITAEK